MKGFPYLLTLGLLAAAMAGCPRAGAQSFGLSVTPSSDSIMISNSLTYMIAVTNLGNDLNDVIVTNILPSSVLFQNATNYYSGNPFFTNNLVLFDLGSFPSTYVARLSVTVKPVRVGLITDKVIVASTDFGATNTVSTNVVVNVTNLVIDADLGVTMIGPKQVVVTNDWMTYGITVTNSGPSAAPGVLLTNTLPAGVIGIFPTNQPAGTDRSFTIPLGMLANGHSTNLQFTVQPTSVTNLTFSASVGAPGVTDTNTANNFATTNIAVTHYLPGLLVAVTNSGQNIDFANGAMQQSILVSNAGPSLVPAVRVVVTGLTNQLFNAVGTNNGNPFVYYSTNLPAGQTVGLLLESFPRGSLAFTNSQLHAFAVPIPDWTPPPVSATSTNINISRIMKLNNGWTLIEFPTTPGRSYTVVYSDNVLFSNAMVAPPSVVAPANRMQWLDYGPPVTVSAPTNASSRFYRVYQDP